MPASATSRAPHASFRQGSVWDAEIPPCAAVTAIGEVINYSADARASAERLPELFARVHAALAPGGVFLFDFATPGRVALREHGPGIRTGDGWSIETAAEEDAVSQTLVRRMTLEYRGRRRSETHTLQLYEREWVRKCLEGPGFRSEALEGYSDFGFWPGYAAFAASKPA